MDKKELENFKYIQLTIDSYYRELEQLEKYKKYESKTNNLSKYKKRIRADIKTLEKKREYILNAINTLDELERQVITYRYIKGLTMETISDKTYYSLKILYNIQKEAIKKLCVLP